MPACCQNNCDRNAKPVQFSRPGESYLCGVMKNLLLFFLMPISLSSVCNAQTSPLELEQRIDSIFSGWRTDSGPGCVVAIVRGDSILYSKGFGLANMEDSIPNSPKSVYYLASVSKQFTGYGIAMLIRNKKINPTEDIRVYLPWLPDYGTKISILNLLHHTSGLRDYFTLLPFTGFGLSGELSQEAALELIKKQKTLNFAPGEKFSYSNTNYVLLSEIIEKVAGIPFPSFLDSAVFRPLQMSSTLIAAGSGKIIKGRARSYAGSPGNYDNVTQTIFTQGDGGMFSTATDMARWMRHLIRLAQKNDELAKLFTLSGRLNNGRSAAYAMGIIPDTVQGQRRLAHKGALAGYKNFMSIYPDAGLGIIICTNGDDGPKTNRAMDAITGVLLPFKSTESTKAENVELIAIPNGLTGDYLARNGSRVKINLKDGRLLDGDQLLVADGPYRFHKSAEPLIRYLFYKTGKAYTLRIEKAGPNQPIEYRYISPGKAMNLKDFVGSYTSDELDFDFTISLAEGRLWLNNKRHGRFRLTMLGADDLFADPFFLDHLVAVKDRNGKIIALEYSSGDVAGLLFQKK